MTATERFWKTREAIESEAKTLRDCFERQSRSRMKLSLLLMLRHGMIEMDNLSDFSDECREELRRGMTALDS